MSQGREDWTVGNFDELYREFFPFPDPSRTDQQVEALVQLLPPTPARILDLGCGEGRHAVRLAQRGYEVVGVDTSRPFLEAARQTAEALGVAVELVECDMREITFDRQFDAAVSIFTAWGYYDDVENEDVLERVARSLRSGGRLVVDVGHRDWLMSVYTPKDWLTLRNGTDVVIDRHFDPIDGVNIVTHRWRDLDGQRHERQHRLRAYTATEINQMLRRAHLRPTAWYGGFSLEPFDRTSRRLLVIAERSETSAD